MNKLCLSDLFNFIFTFGIQLVKEFI